MTVAILYRWRLHPGREAEFRAAWAEGTALIHARCSSFGARLHDGADGLVWSYARWPSETARRSCFDRHDFFALPCFRTMQACIAERFDEIVLGVTEDLLREPGK